MRHTRHPRGLTAAATALLLAGAGLLAAPAGSATTTSPDTTPPSAPAWEIFVAGAPDCTTLGWEVTDESEDDVTPQEALRYEVLEAAGGGELRVVDDDFPLSGTGLENLTALPEQMKLRSVDEAGNPSAAVLPVDNMHECR